jgi:phosphate starvation-inducible membrane PsiE
LTSASGTLSCTVPASIGNSTVIAKLYKDSSYIAQGTVKLDQKPSDIYGGIQIVLAFFLMITLIGAGMSDNPVFTIIFFMVGVICLTAMNLVANNGFIGATATILFLIAAIFIVVIKAARRN